MILESEHTRWGVGFNSIYKAQNLALSFLVIPLREITLLPTGLLRSHSRHRSFCRFAANNLISFCV